MKNNNELTLAELLDGSNTDNFKLTSEDKAWLNAPSVGLELDLKGKLDHEVQKGKVITGALQNKGE